VEPVQGPAVEEEQQSIRYSDWPSFVHRRTADRDTIQPQAQEQ